MSLLIVPVIPEILRYTQDKLHVEESPTLCSKAAAISLTTQSLGYICGPIVGGSLYDEYGFRGTTDVLMISALILSILYYLLNIRPSINQDEREEEEEKVPLVQKRQEYRYSSLSEDE